MRSCALLFAMLVVLGWTGPAFSCEYNGLAYSDGAEACIMGSRAVCRSGDEASDWQVSGETCGFRIAIASAKYGSADQWCSAFDWIAHACSGRWDCLVSVADTEFEWESQAERVNASRKLVCGPLSKARKVLSIGWYCSDGEVYLGQFRVAVPDGGHATLSCGGSGLPR